MAQTVLIFYDIPDGAGVANPRRAFCRNGIALQLSVMYCRADRIPWQLINGLLEARADVDVVELGDVETARFLKVAHKALLKDIQKAEVRQTESLERAAATLKAVEDDPEHTRTALWRAQTKYDKDRQNILKKTEKLLADLKSGADSCDIDVTSLGFAGLSGRVRQLRSLAHSRARTASLVAEQLEQIGSPLAAAAKADDMPPEVALDALEDAGQDTVAARAVFANGREPAANGNGASATTTQFVDVEVMARNRNGHSGNGTVTATQGSSSRIYRSQPRRFEVRTQRNGIRTVTSCMTDAEARGICSNMERSTFARDIASRRSLSASQRAWLHVLAVGEVGQDSQVGPEPEPAVQAAAARTTSAPEAEIIPTTALLWESTTKMFTGEASFLALRTMPSRLMVRSHVTGNVQEFVQSDVARDAEGEVLYHEFTGPEGTTLRIYND